MIEIEVSIEHTMGENMLHALRPKFIDGSHLRSIQEHWLPQTLPDVTSPSLMDSRPSVATEIQIDQLALFDAHGLSFDGQFSHTPCSFLALR